MLTDQQKAVVQKVLDDHTPDPNPCDCCGEMNCQACGATATWSPDHVMNEIEKALAKEMK